MTITFQKSKDNCIYEQYVNDPTDRAKMRAFNKVYSSQIASEAVKLHKRLMNIPTAAAYNRMFGSTANRIEIKRGTKDKAPLCLKVRVSGAWRKFFYQLVGDEFLLTGDWTGDFETITHIHIHEINKHDYDSVN